MDKKRYIVKESSAPEPRHARLNRDFMVYDRDKKLVLARCFSLAEAHRIARDRNKDAE
jgi:hypothetical protein